MSMTLDSTGQGSTKRGDTWGNPDSGMVPGIPRRKADQDQASGGIEFSGNPFQDRDQVGSKVFPGRVRATPLADLADHGMAATPELAWQPRQPPFGGSIDPTG